MKFMDAFELALEHGLKELDDARRRQRLINLRVEQLEAIVAQLRAFTTSDIGNVAAPPSLFDSSQQLRAATFPDQSEKCDSSVPLWKAILNALNGSKSDFTVPEALRALERTGRTIASKNRLNIVRNTILQKEEIFGKLSAGHYYVRGFERAEHEREGSE